MRSMNASKACGSDGVPFHSLLNCFAVIGPHLLRIVNLSIRSGVFPDRWKTACVVPIPKSGDPNISSNNRPTSLLSTLSKILEKAFATSFQITYMRISSSPQINTPTGHTRVQKTLYLLLSNAS